MGCRAFRVAGFVAIAVSMVSARQQRSYYPTFAEQSLDRKVEAARRLPKADQPAEILEIAKRLRQIKGSPVKLNLAGSLAHLAENHRDRTDVVQAAAEALAEALAQGGDIDRKIQDLESDVLAELTTYFGAHVSLDTPAYKNALAKIDARTKLRQAGDFTLQDSKGNAWTLSQLKGKVVLVNFWGLSCDPCLAEMPRFQAAYKKYRDQGFVILAITADSADRLEAYLTDHPLDFPLLTDSNWRVGKKFGVVGVPVSLVYDREGKLVAESFDDWTEDELTSNLAKAGLK